MPALSDIVDQMANVTLHDNILVLEVDNLLNGWPTYEINFTPEKPGPLKLIIRLHDAVKLKELEDSSDSEVEELFSGKSKGRKRLRTNTKGLGHPDTPVQSNVSDLVDSGTCSNNHFNAKPIQLLGLRVLKEPALPKIPVSRKRPFHDTDWPPRRPRRLRRISPDERITELHTFRTFSAAVAPANAT
ncbi:hypothetical protein CY34DRAFT_18798 [Suillus luteus UH-Slu-Lm8-n1]|uniref:Uncharacterized protein n=1 Tax=Suillus luteus UH-Slu-Lm8-n1 TaxID=930992 RepID=A0A0C9Z5P9_9AGAM|nr:hypothetical protein CY34DRAFT_18798 [Suillus luteus UH-Slu-Lm8-n1]